MAASNGRLSFLSPEKVEEYWQETITYLAEHLFISDLSTLEKKHLRRVLIEVLTIAEHDYQSEIDWQFKVGSCLSNEEKDKCFVRWQYWGLLSIENFSRETAYRWVLEMFDIDLRTVDLLKIVIDKYTGESFLFHYPDIPSAILFGPDLTEFDRQRYLETRDRQNDKERELKVLCHDWEIVRTFDLKVVRFILDLREKFFRP